MNNYSDLTKDNLYKILRTFNLGLTQFWAVHLVVLFLRFLETLLCLRCCFCSFVYAWFLKRVYSYDQTRKGYLCNSILKEMEKFVNHGQSNTAWSKCCLWLALISPHLFVPECLPPLSAVGCGCHIVQDLISLWKTDFPQALEIFLSHNHRVQKWLLS